MSNRDPFFLEFAPLQRVAICRPSHFALREAINVIQRAELGRGRPVDRLRAEHQHDELRAALSKCGVECVEVQSDQRFPYQLNVRDAGVATPAGLILARFRRAIRAGEEQLASAAAAAAGLSLSGAVTDGHFEGGDFVALGESQAAVGLGDRTDQTGLQSLRALLGDEPELIAVPFEAEYLHLDMIFNVIAPKLALACTEALPDRFLSLIEEKGLELIRVSRAEVLGHACNVLAIESGTVLSHAANGRVNQSLTARGLSVIAPDLSELARSGGGPRCLTLPLERGKLCQRR